jgi:hypothetical protein
MRYITTIVTFMLPFLIFAKADNNYYDIKITIKGIQSEKALLGYYYGDKTYVVDSAKVDAKSGKMRFFGNRKLLEGVYFVANTEGVILDFIVNGWKDFSITTHYNALVDSITVFRSEENKNYFDYLKAVKRKQSEIKKLQADLTILQYKNDYPTFELYQRKIIEKYRFIDNLTYSSLKRYPDLFFSKLIGANRTPSVSDEIRPYDEVGKPNPAYYYYGCRHFWDEFDFNDTRLLRSKVYGQKMKQYLNQIMPSNLDSLKLYSDFLLAKSKVTLEFYQYTLNYMTQFFEERTSQTNGDKMYIYMCENYHHRTGSGKDASKLAEMNEKVKQLKATMIGNKIHNIELPDASGYIRCVKESKSKWTLMFFYDPEKDTTRSTQYAFDKFLKNYDADLVKGFTICNNKLNLDMSLEKPQSGLLFMENEKPESYTYIYKACSNYYLLDKDFKIVEKSESLEKMKEILRGLNLKQ